MNLVLIGYRGTGKTAIGRRLAERLDLAYVGLDDEIVRRAGKSIPEIVAEAGWDRFRDIESEVVRDAAARDRCVLDTGGGAILRRRNVEALRRNGFVVWLRAGIADIVRRIHGDTQRPSLTGQKSFTEEVEEVLAERRPKYAAAADVEIDTSSLSIDAAADRIAALFLERIASPRRGS
ncbi:MAG: shikimate kinase [Planctomycetes bacterium]|nr:shikimate kinase [Planctomycetota bacterium]